MGYGKGAINSINYDGDDFKALKTNSGRDTRVESPDEIQRDLEKIGFKNFESWIRPPGPGGHQKNWIFFTAIK